MLTPLQRRVLALKRQHGTWRATAKAVGIDHITLWKYAKGLSSPRDPKLMAKLGVERKIVYWTTGA